MGSDPGSGDAVHGRRYPPPSMSIFRRTCALTLAALACSCSLPEALARLEDHAPSPALGRPAWVQGVARVGAYLGGAIGGVGALVTFPVLKVLTVAAGDALGADEQDLLYAPVAIGAGAGHVVLGAPLDALTFVFVGRGGEADGPAFEMAVPPVGPGPSHAQAVMILEDVTDAEEGDGS